MKQLNVFSGLYLILLSLCGMSIIVVFFIALNSIYFPYELEWVESACLNMTNQIYEGKPLYAPPSIEYIPLTYTPLYFYIGGVYSKFKGRSLSVLREISFVFFVCTLIEIFYFVRNETNNWKAGFIAMGFYCAVFELNGAWYHLARVDSMFIFFYFSGTILLYKASRYWQIILSSLLLFFSFLTKQTTILFLPFFIPYLIIVKRKYLIIFISIIVLCIGGSTLIANYQTDGLYKFYIFDFQIERGFNIYLIYEYIKIYLLPIIITALFCISIFSYCWIYNRHLFLEKFFNLYMMFVSLIISFSAITQPGGAMNNMMPAYLWIAICISIYFHIFQRSLFIGSTMYVYTIDLLQKSKIVRSAPQIGTASSGDRAALLLCCINTYARGLIGLCTIFISLIYNPNKYIPTRNDYIAGQYLSQIISTIQGDVWIPHTTSYYFLTHKKIYAHQATIGDMQRSSIEKYGQFNIEEQLCQLIKERRFCVIIIALENVAFQKILIQEGYWKRNLFSDPTMLFTKTGRRLRPSIIFLSPDHSCYNERLFDSHTFQYEK